MEFKFNVEHKGQISDGYHTFDELYYHRMMLFSVICNTYKDKAWKSWKHDDGTMYDDYFIVGIDTEEGQYTYHYHKDNWDMFEVKELEYAPVWDGHKPKDITRLLTLLDGNILNSYKDRFIKEYKGLSDRVNKLGSMLSKYLADELDFVPDCSYNLLHEQYVYMINYLNVLERRAILEDIDIKNLR